MFEQSPPEVDTYIQPSDSQLFAECLRSLEVSRFEINPAPVAGAEPEGSPRSLSIKMEFGLNEWFEDDVLEKKLWFRRAKDNWTGLVSEPVNIRWKKGKDLTHGLTNAAANLWEARRKMSAATEGDPKESELEEAEALAEKLELSDEAAPSFFTLFSFVSGRRYVSPEESAAANAAEAERREKRSRGEKVEEPEPENDTEDQDPFAEILPNGDDLPNLIAEEVWPNAIKYFSMCRPVLIGTVREGR